MVKGKLFGRITAMILTFCLLLGMTPVIYAQNDQTDGNYTIVNRYLTIIEEAGDLNVYDDESVARIHAAVATVIPNLGADKQDQIDEMANNLFRAWNSRQYRRLLVTFDPNGGACEVTERYYRYAEAYSDLPVATRGGYTFLGWYIAPSGGLPVDGQVIVKELEDHKLYAQWERDNADYSKVDSALARIPGDLTPYTPETKRTLQEAVDAVVYGLGTDRQSQINGWADAILQAINGLVKKTLTVTFYPNGGTVSSETKRVSYGDTMVTPVPVRSNYTFAGWYTAESGGTQYTDSTPITGNVTLYARWMMKPADYSEVNKAIGEIPADLSIYTTKSVAALEAAKNAVKQGVGKGEQAVVDGWAVAIRNATEELVRKTPFADVKETSWYHDSISALYYGGIVKGTTETTYDPSGNTTRAQMVVLLYRVSGEPETSVRNPFADVLSKSYYYDAVRWGYGNGIVKGLSQTSYGPNEKITREQFATMLYRLCGEPETGGSLSGYPDGTAVSQWAREAMIWAVESGIIQGDTTGQLKPTNYATRAEAATMLQRYIKLVK